MLKKTSKAIFFIHGFTEDFDRSFGRFIMHTDLNKYQIIRHAVVGHDGQNLFDHSEAIVKLETEFEVVRKAYEEVIVIGFSMGGVLASHLANIYSVDKLVLVAPSFKYFLNTNTFALVGDFIATIGKEVVNNIKKISATKDIIDKYIDERYAGKDFVYSDLTFENISDVKRAILSFMSIVKYVDDRLGKINCPTLIIHGEKDELIPLESSTYILDKITHPNRALIVAPSALHRVLCEENVSVYCQCIEGFIKHGYIKLNMLNPK